MAYSERVADLPKGLSRKAYPSLTRWTRSQWRGIGGGMLAIAGALLITGFLRQRTGRKRAELSLAERVRFESLLSEISARLIHVPLSEWDAEIERALQRVAEFLRIDRANLNDFIAGEPPLCISWAAAEIEGPAAHQRARSASLDGQPARAGTGRPFLPARRPPRGGGGRSAGLSEHGHAVIPVAPPERRRVHAGRTVLRLRSA